VYLKSAKNRTALIFFIVASQPGHRGRTGRSAGRGNHQPGAGDARDDPSACLDSPALLSGDTRFGHRHLLLIKPALSLRMKWTVTRVWVDGQFITVTGSGYSGRVEFQVDGKTIDLLQIPGRRDRSVGGALNNDSAA